MRTDKLLQIQAKIEAIEERSAKRKSSVENRSNDFTLIIMVNHDDNHLRQKKASTKVRWQEMVLKLHISSPASANRQLIEKSDGNKEEVGDCENNVNLNFVCTGESCRHFSLHKHGQGRQDRVGELHL